MDIIQLIIVDDHTLFRVSLKTALECGYPDICVTGEANCGKDLFALLPSTPVDIVLLDINLPDMSGAEIALHLRREYPNVKILAVSGENASQTIQSMLEAGIDGFVSKQKCDADELAGAIRSVMGGLEYFGRDISAIIFGVYVSKKKTAEVTPEFTERERDIIIACRDGLEGKEIAARLDISVNTVNVHKRNIFQKLGINNTMEMVQFALKKGLIPLIFLLMFAACTSKPDSAQLYYDLPVDTTWTPTGNERLDKIIKSTAIAPLDTNQVLRYYQIGQMLQGNNIEQAKAYYLKMDALSVLLDYQFGQYLFANTFSNLLIREGLFDSAVTVVQKAHQLAIRESNEEWAANMLYAKGNAFLIRQWYATALICYMEALPNFEQRSNIAHRHNIYYMMSQLYKSLNDLDKAIEYGEKSITPHSEDPYSFYALGSAHSGAHQYEKAKGYYEEALRLCKLQNNTFLEGSLYSYLADDALMVFDLDKSERYARQALEIVRQYSAADYAPVIITLSKIEMMKGNFNKSEEYAREALQVAIEFDKLKEKRECYIILSKLAVAKHKYRDHIQYWKEFELVEMAIAEETSLRAAKEMEAKYETAKKELEINRQQQVITRQNILRWLLMAGIAITIVFLALLWYMLRLRTRRNRVLADLNATKDKFFSIISHDMRNPVVAQRNALQLLVQHGHLWEIDRLMAYYLELLKSADGQVELIYNLLSWAQLHTGRMSCSPDTFVLTDLLADLTLIHKMAENKGVTLVAQIPSNTLVTGDRNMLATVIRNLLNNAIKFTATGGTVTLSVEPADNGKYTVIVSDTGVGMSREQIGNLFSLDSAQSCKGTSGEQGSGLGLIVCNEFLEKHGSKMHVESEEGKGSRFWFTV